MAQHGPTPDLGHWRSPVTAELRARFEALSREWIDATSHSSTFAQVHDHPAYRAIVAMGWSVVPLLLEAIASSERGFWYPAIVEITGENPTGGVYPGSSRQVRELFLAWGRQRGLIQ